MLSIKSLCISTEEARSSKRQPVEPQFAFKPAEKLYFSPPVQTANTLPSHPLPPRLAVCPPSTDTSRRSSSGSGSTESSLPQRPPSTTTSLEMSAPISKIPECVQISASVAAPVSNSVSATKLVSTRPQNKDIIDRRSPTYSLISPQNKDIVDRRSPRFECKECGKTFARAIHLRNHEKVHEDKKPYRCTTCDAHFLRKHDLRRHLRIHDGVKPFVCERCGRGFARKDGLRRHENMESSVKKYRCVARSSANSRSKASDDEEWA
ncbi:MAG: hypothetical protein SGCHY_005160 [Lobulomycetales sp.]